MEALRFLGVPTALYTIISSLHIYFRGNGFSLKEHPLSNVADKEDHALFYKVSMMSVATIRMFYYLSYADYFSVAYWWVVAPILINGISFLLTIFFTTGKHHKFHYFISMTTFLAFLALFFSLGVAILPINPVIATSYLAVATMNFITGFFMYRKYKSAAITELVFAIFVITGDVILLLALV